MVGRGLLRVLTAWCFEELVGVQRLRPRDSQDLSKAKALDALARPDLWSTHRELSVYVTKLGEEIAFERWPLAD